MRHRLFMPEEVRAALREHISRATQAAVDGYSSAAEDEDTMTGHLGGALRVPAQHVLVPPGNDQPPGQWTWSITYYKFRGHGRGATESILGADAIFELRVAVGYRTETKSILFQAKMASDGGGRRLLEQCIRLSTWREAAFVVSYAEFGFQALSLDAVIATRGSLRNVTTGKPLAVFLGTDFLDCEVGDTDLRYDARSRRLIWRTIAGEVVATTFPVKHRIRVNVQAPAFGSAPPGVDRLVPPDAVHRYRMNAEDEEILGLQRTGPASAIKTAQRLLALAYHPDRASELDQLMREIMNRRMQEVNDAAARVRAKRAES